MIVAAATRWVERTALPDAITRAGIAYLVGRTGRRLASADPAAEEAFARGMAAYPIAEHADAANSQHYELPAAFFAHALGPRRKYSCCLYPTGRETLAEAEEAALAATVARARLADGQDILELGCGWGSLSLYMAEHFPGARITAVSNSHSQRAFIEGVARAKGFANLRVITCDMNDFASDERFDRVVSVEMFEHMANWQALLARVRGWLRPEGRLFLHVFTHDQASYRFLLDNKADWIAQHFFTGGIMPGHQLIRHFPDLFALEEEWRWNGTHYEKTALDWLANYDREIAAIRPILRDVYAADAKLWERRWRLFFLATAGLFGHQGGEPWAVSHYLLRPVEE
jgi:cyclopropane-fatty-acyl-phospholipid synthase